MEKATKQNQRTGYGNTGWLNVLTSANRQLGASLHLHRLASGKQAQEVTHATDY